MRAFSFAHTEEWVARHTQPLSMTTETWLRRRFLLWSGADLSSFLYPARGPVPVASSGRSPVKYKLSLIIICSLSHILSRIWCFVSFLLYFVCPICHFSHLFSVFDLLVFFDSRFSPNFGPRMGEVERPQGPSTLNPNFDAFCHPGFVPYLDFPALGICHINPP